ncbi:hypothetical protein D3C87_1551740 [compost metagenome]
MPAVSFVYAALSVSGLYMIVLLISDPLTILDRRSETIEPLIDTYVHTPAELVADQTMSVTPSPLKSAGNFA